ncbi:hypothetical protein JHK85_041615 [Glycine max]|nr:hypothetical protein JHK86_041004 [Glycine max]KAG4966640.1 hypothetical protein JHK85_041615 [Glycine max]
MGRCILIDWTSLCHKGPGSTALDFKENKKLDYCMHPPLMYIPDSISASIEQQIICMGNKKVKSTELAGLNGQKHPLLKKALSWSFDDIIHGCAKQKNHMLARKLMLQIPLLFVSTSNMFLTWTPKPSLHLPDMCETLVVFLVYMKNLGLQPSRHTYNGIIKVVSHRSYGDAVRVLKKMQQKNLKPYDSTLASLSITCSKALQLDLAEAFLNQISECVYPNPYNALLASCNQLSQPERAIRLFAKIVQKKVLPNIRTCELLFSLFGVVNAHYEDSDAWSQVDAAKRINAIEKHMANNGIQHSHLSMNKLKWKSHAGRTRRLPRRRWSRAAQQASRGERARKKQSRVVQQHHHHAANNGEEATHAVGIAQKEKKKKSGLGGRKKK